MLFKAIELKEGNEAQYLGAYLLDWKHNICHKPTIAFIEATEEDLQKALKDKNNYKLYSQNKEN